MFELKLDAHIVDGKIEISEEQRQELNAIKNGAPVEVILRADDLQVSHKESSQRDILQEMAERGYDSIIDYLLDYPLRIEGTYLTRDELYSGKRFGD
jgi:hypothetical protein